MLPRSQMRSHQSTRWSCWKRAVEIVTWEGLLTRSLHSNGGAVIIARALRTAAVLSIMGLAAHNLLGLLDGTRELEWSWSAATAQIIVGIPWFAGLFGATYAGLYARFASQWSYLAGVYNSIKAAEVSLCTRDHGARWTLSEWKAGFIEDAESLHLATKPTVAPVILAWGKDHLVRRAFRLQVPGGAARLCSLILRVDSSLENWTKRHQSEWQCPD